MPVLVRTLAERIEDRMRVARGELELVGPPPNDPRCTDEELEAAIEAAKPADAAADARYLATVARVADLERQRLELRHQRDSLSVGMRGEAQQLALGARYVLLERHLEAAERARTAALFEAQEARTTLCRFIQRREALKRAAHTPTIAELAASIEQDNRRKAASGSTDRTELVIIRDPQSVARAYSSPAPAAPPDRSLARHR